MGWADWIRDGGEVEPSLYAADFMRLGEQIGQLLDAGARIFHFDVGDAHFVPPVTFGPIVLRSIAATIHEAGGRIDCHLMVDDPQRHFAEIASSGGDSVTFHVETGVEPAGTAAAARSHGLAVGVAFNPETTPREAASFARAAGAEIVLCMSIHPGYGGQEFMSEALGRVAELRDLVEVPIQVDGGVGETNARPLHEAGALLLVAGTAVLGDPDPPAAYARIVAAAS